MSDTKSKRRMSENEAVFRHHNEKVQRGLKQLKELAKEHDQESYVEDVTIPLHFFCECSDENCRERIKLKPARYEQIHKNRNRFVIICGHESKSIEKVVAKEDGFCIVEKFVGAPEVATKLHKTDADDT